jgi:hypothetical protein
MKIIQMTLMIELSGKKAKKFGSFFFCNYTMDRRPPLHEPKPKNSKATNERPMLLAGRYILGFLGSGSRVKSMGPILSLQPIRKHLFSNGVDFLGPPRLMGYSAKSMGPILSLQPIRKHLFSNGVDFLGPSRLMGSSVKSIGPILSL